MEKQIAEHEDLLLRGKKQERSKLSERRSLENSITNKDDKFKKREILRSNTQINDNFEFERKSFQVKYKLLILSS